MPGQVNAIYAIIIILGLAAGSFLNVCITRLPAGKSVIHPGSSCPGCGRRLGIIDLIPVLSFLMLRGCCRYCRCRIPWRYPLVEVLCAAGYTGLFYHQGISCSMLGYVLLFSGLLVAAFTDIEEWIIPDRLLIFMVLCFIGLLPCSGISRLLDNCSGALCGILVLLLPALLYPGGMGGGDIKMAAVIGLYLGWKQVLLAIFVAVFVASLLGLAWVMLKHRTLKTAMPFGPFLAWGAMFSMLYGDRIILWYWQFVNG